MSEYQDRVCSTEYCRSGKLYICLLTSNQQFSNLVINLLSNDRYRLEGLNSLWKMINFVAENQEQIDCIILVRDSQTGSVLHELRQLEVLLPIVILELEQPETLWENSPTKSSTTISLANTVYHQAEVRLYPIQLKEINFYINLAIVKFLSLTPDSYLSDRQELNGRLPKNAKSLITQQHRLTKKLKQKIGKSIDYRRNSARFYRNLSAKEQNELEQKLNHSYRQILLRYFDENSQVNELIDEFVDRAFLSDISTSQILEIHMNLIDEFCDQLKIEGRSNDILLDYRLPLIDLMSHLCEMYRTSIPQELSLELLFTLE